MSPRPWCSQHWGLLELRPVDLTLEDVFVRLVTEEKESAA